MPDASKDEDETFGVLLQAASTGRTDMVQTILKDYGADVSRQQEGTGSTALHLACANGHVDCVRALLRAGAPTHITDANDARPLDLVAADTPTTIAFQAELLQCVTSGRLDAVSELLSGGVDPNNDGLPEGSSILNWAVSFQQPQEMLALLVQFGANVNQVGARGKTALHEACQNGDADAFTYMLSIGAQADMADADSHDPRHFLPSQELRDQFDEFVEQYKDVVPSAFTKTAANQEQVEPERSGNTDVDAEDPNADTIIPISDGPAESPSQEPEFVVPLTDIPALRRQVYQLEKRNEELVTVVSNLRADIETLLKSDPEQQALVQQLQLQKAQLEQNLRGAADEVNELREAAIQQIPPEVMCYELQLLPDEALTAVRETWVKESVTEKQSEFEHERASYVEHINRLEKQVAELERSRGGNSGRWTGESSSQRGSPSSYSNGYNHNQQPDKLALVEKKKNSSLLNTVISLVFGWTYEDEQEYVPSPMLQV